MRPSGEVFDALVPVGLATGPTRGMANRVSGLLVKLPVGSGDVEQTFATSLHRPEGRRKHTRSWWPCRPEVLEPLPRPALAAFGWLVQHQPFFT